MNKTFQTKKGILLGLVIWGAVLLAFFEVGLPGVINLKPVPIILHLFIFSFVGTIWFGIRYQVKDKQLKVKLGPFTPWQVDIMNIHSVSRSYNPLSSPATSLRRIVLKLKDGGFLLLSPSNEQSFIKTLTEVSPEIDNKVEEESAKGVIKYLYWLL